MSARAEYMGDQPADGLYCLRCRRPILDGERWLQLWSPDDAYAVSCHLACWKPEARPHRDFQEAASWGA
ncbi:MAG: hypothetical protein KatS3mg050_1843 [Litorilinea sp.]|nr:MAG: hypothetical protein KatS3mg050_1843 [Litorilinea sp.]